MLCLFFKMFEGKMAEQWGQLCSQHMLGLVLGANAALGSLIHSTAGHEKVI